jgi:hypothetical protein
MSVRLILRRECRFEGDDQPVRDRFRAASRPNRPQRATLQRLIAATDRDRRILSLRGQWRNTSQDGDEE